MSQNLYRVAIRRAHRTLGSYLVQWAWANGVDCIVIERKSYLRFAGLTRIEDERVNRLREDLSSIFPYSRAINYTKNKKKWATVYISRFEFPGSVFGTPLSTNARVERFNNAGLRTAVATLLDEASIVEAMARVACGLEDFKKAPWSS